MTSHHKKELNDFLVHTFHGILKVQEDSLRTGSYPDLSLSKMHIIEEICNREQSENNMSAIAESLDITVGTLTVAVESLVKKGYIRRIKSKSDKRVVLITPTEKGLDANKEHEEFHKAMVTGAIEGLTEDELIIFTKGVKAVSNHFKKLKTEHNER